MTAVGDEEVDSADRAGTEERARESGSESESAKGTVLTEDDGITGSADNAESAEAAENTAEVEDPEDPEDSEDDDEQDRKPGMTPRQARRIRMVTSGVVMVAVAVALVVRLGSAPSLLTVGGYGIALILSGTAIVLSRRGRTRVATAVLACGFLMVIVAERLLSSTA